MLPEAFSARMQRLLGDEYEAFLASYDRPRAVGLRMNPLRHFAGSVPYVTAPVPWAENGFYYSPDTRPGLDPMHDAGVYYLQEPSAMAPAALLEARPGEIVLDLCAAPGGKSTQIAAAMQGEGLLVSNEIVGARAKILSQNLERMGVGNALVVSEHPARLQKLFPAFFDRVMVDAPCSGEGMFRKEEAAVRDWSPEQVLVCADRQREILESAAAMLKSGGRLVYSTCTFAPEENEGVISAFLRDHMDFEIEGVSAPCFTAGRPDWVEAPAPGIENTFRLFPHKLVGEGHFAAVLRRRGDWAPSELPCCRQEKLPEELRKFLKETGITLPAGKLLTFGDTLYWAPPAMPELKGLKVLRAGLCLGICKKGRFEPDHALAMWSGCDAPLIVFPRDSVEINAYLHGDVVASDATGWQRIGFEGCALGWVKGSGGVLKNHLPKGLRRLSC